jgi:hypothetical protein
VGERERKTDVAWVRVRYSPAITGTSLTMVNSKSSKFMAHQVCDEQLLCLQASLQWFIDMYK